MRVKLPAVEDVRGTCFQLWKPCYVERARDPFRASDASAVVIRKEW